MEMDIEVLNKFEKLMKKFKSEVSKVVEDSASSLYCDYLPYVIEDTKLNFELRVNDCLQLIAGGKFTVSKDEDILTVTTGELGHEIKITASLWDSARDTLAAQLSDEAKDLKIKSLEDEIKFMRESWGV